MLDRGVRALCIGLAALGGLLFVAQALMSVASIVGRALWSRPVPGDYELVQLACAGAVALCLPYCQLVRGHVIVDVTTRRMSAALRGGLDRVAALGVAVVALALARGSAIGLAELREYGETTMVLGLPVWWGYVPLVPSFAMLALVALLMAARGADR